MSGCITPPHHWVQYVPLITYPQVLYSLHKWLSPCGEHGIPSYLDHFTHLKAFLKCKKTQGTDSAWFWKHFALDCLWKLLTSRLFISTLKDALGKTNTQTPQNCKLWKREQDCLLIALGCMWKSLRHLSPDSQKHVHDLARYDFTICESAGIFPWPL